MPGISRIGDMNLGKGLLIRPCPTVFANGRPVAPHVNISTPHGLGKHLIAKTINGSPSVYVGGSPAVRIGTFNTCLHPVITGSSDVFCS